MNVREIYLGSNGDATKALYARLEQLGPVGVVALNLFRAQKCSARAKVYRRRSHKDEAYGRKNWSIENLCKVLTEHALELRMRWGWKQDPEQDYHTWVLYVDLPTGQVSFHSATRVPNSPYYAGEWDGKHLSEQRIVDWVSRVAGEPLRHEVVDDPAVVTPGDPPQREIQL